MTKSALLSFISTEFKIEEGEDEETNPGVYGKALALWLSEQLNARAIKTGEPFAEDFGWCVPIASDSFSLYAACSNFDDAGQEWGVFAFAEGGMLSRLFGGDQRKQSVTALYQSLHDILHAAPQVKELKEEAG